MATRKERLQKLYEKYTQGITELAMEIYLGKVVPFCDKHGLWLVQAMNDFEGVKFFGWPGEQEKGTSNDWDERINYPDEFEDFEEGELPPIPEGYEELRKQFLEIPSMKDVTLLWFMPEYKPEVKRG
jgi:hypothetical protein